MLMIDLSPDLLRAYHAMAETQNRTVEAVLVAQLERMKAHPPGHAIMVLAGDTLEKLQAALAGPPVASSRDLIQRVQALAGIRLGTIQLDFSAKQLDELQRRAERQGKPIGYFVQEIADHLSQNLLWCAGGKDTGFGMSHTPPPSAAPGRPADPLDSPAG